MAQVHSGRFEQIYYLVELGSAGSVTQRHGARTAAGWLRSPAALVQSGAWGGIARRLRADRRAYRPDHPDLPAQFGRPVEVALYPSPRRFHEKPLLDTIRRCLAQYRITDGCLELEITEKL